MFMAIATLAALFVSVIFGSVWWKRRMYKTVSGIFMLLGVNFVCGIVFFHTGLLNAMSTGFSLQTVGDVLFKLVLGTGIWTAISIVAGGFFNLRGDARKKVADSVDTTNEILDELNQAKGPVSKKGKQPTKELWCYQCWGCGYADEFSKRRGTQSKSPCPECTKPMSEMGVKLFTNERNLVFTYDCRCGHRLVVHRGRLHKQCHKCGSHMSESKERV